LLLRSSSRFPRSSAQSRGASLLVTCPNLLVGVVLADPPTFWHHRQRWDERHPFVKGRSLPPQSNLIAPRQIQQNARTLQAAARLEYDRAILLRRIRTSLNFLLAAVGPILIILRPQWGVWLGAAAAGWLFFSRVTIDPYAKRRILRGALALEQFDCYVYGLAWNDALGEPLADEEIIAAAAHSKYVGQWYPDVSAAERPIAVLICQRTNVVWSRRQHAIYAGIVALAAWAWLAIGIIVTLYSSADLAAYLLGVAFPSVPVFLDAIEIRNANAETAQRRRELEVTLDKAISHPTRRNSTDTFLRAIQDQIFVFRSTSPLIPKLVYLWLRKSFNTGMEEAAAKQISGASV
jgi:hypothetical protein